MSIDTHVNTPDNPAPGAPTPHTMPAGLGPSDSALVIGLALACVRQGGRGAVPAPLLTQLATLVDAGDPTSALVSHWLEHCSYWRRPQPSSSEAAAEIIAAAKSRGGL